MNCTQKCVPIYMGMSLNMWNFVLAISSQYVFAFCVLFSLIYALCTSIHIFIIYYHMHNINIYISISRICIIVTYQGCSVLPSLLFLCLSFCTVSHSLGNFASFIHPATHGLKNNTFPLALCYGFPPQLAYIVRRMAESVIFIFSLVLVFPGLQSIHPISSSDCNYKNVFMKICQHSSVHFS